MCAHASMCAEPSASFMAQDLWVCMHVCAWTCMHVHTCACAHVCFSYRSNPEVLRHRESMAAVVGIHLQAEASLEHHRW